jgi:hypothetical protein
MSGERSHQFSLENDLAGQSEEQVLKEIREMAERADRVRRRIHRNAEIPLFKQAERGDDGGQGQAKQP